MKDKEAFKAEVKRRLEAARVTRESMSPPAPAPRYDRVFWDGLEWLNQQ